MLQGDGAAYRLQLAGPGLRKAAVEGLRHLLACQLRLLQLAADFAADWVRQQRRRGGQEPPLDGAAPGLPRLAEVEAAAGNAHCLLLVAHGVLSSAEAAASAAAGAAAPAAAAAAAVTAAPAAAQSLLADLECVSCLDAARETTLALCGHR